MDISNDSSRADSLQLRVPDNQNNLGLYICWVDLKLRKLIKSIEFVTHIRGKPGFRSFGSDWSTAQESLPYWLLNCSDIKQNGILD